jgi:MFS family permease
VTANAVTARYPALASQPFRRFWSGSFASVGATQLVTLAQGWLVYELSGSALDLGLLGAATAIPNIVVSLAGGVVADRFDKRRIILGASALTALLLLGLALLDATETVQVWHVLTIAALTSAISGVEWPTRQAYFPHLIARDGLMSAVALNAFVWQSTRMVMPALGGAIIAVSDTSVVFVLAAIGTAAMCVVMLGLRVDAPRYHSTTSALAQIRESLDYIWSNELFRFLIALSFAGMFFANAYMQILPAFAAALGEGETGYGMLLSASGMGSVAGTFAVTLLQRRWRLGVVVLGSSAASALCLYGFAAAAAAGAYLLALAAVFAVAFWSSAFMISSMTALQLEVPDALRGRVMGFHSITYSLMPLGGLVLGALADAASPALAVVLGASAYLACVAAVAWRRPSIRGLVAQAAPSA